MTPDRNILGRCTTRTPLGENTVISGLFYFWGIGLRLGTRVMVWYRVVWKGGISPALFSPGDIFVYGITSLCQQLIRINRISWLYIVQLIVHHKISAATWYYYKLNWRIYIITNSVRGGWYSPPRIQSVALAPHMPRSKPHGRAQPTAVLQAYPATSLLCLL